MVSNSGKGAAIEGRQVSVEKVNASKPLMTHREVCSAVETVEVRSLRDQSEGYSAYCSDGGRCKDGTSSTWALMGNAGNLAFDAKGNDKWFEAMRKNTNAKVSSRATDSSSEALCNGG